MSASADPFAPIAAQLNAPSTPQPPQQKTNGSADPFASIAAQLNTNAAPPQSGDNWSNWNPDQTLSSYGAATRSAVGGLVNDTLSAVKGAASLINPTAQNDAEKEAFKVAGVGGVLAHRLYAGISPSLVSPTEIASAIHDINQSKDPVGTYLKAAQKTASQGAGQALTALATEGAVKAIPAVADVASGVKSVASDVVQGADKAQVPAQAALRSGASASAVEAGVEAGSQGGSIRSLLDDPIDQLATKERAAYDTINEASGTDLKSLYDARAKFQDALENPNNIDKEDALQAKLDQTEAQISTGEAQAKENGVDPDDLEDAKNMTKQRYAMEDISKKLFNNESVVSGNTAHGAPENINVDSAIRQAENLDKPSKFAPRGTPSRLEQAFGSDGAQALKQSLYDAQKAGQTALARQAFAKTLAKIGGYGGAILGGGELVKHLIP